MEHKILGLQRAPKWLTRFWVILEPPRQHKYWVAGWESYIICFNSLKSPTENIYVVQKWL